MSSDEAGNKAYILGTTIFHYDRFQRHGSAGNAYGAVSSLTDVEIERY